MIPNINRPEIIIVDDHPAFRQGLMSIITSADIATVIGAASDGAALIELLSFLRPNLVLMSIDMPHMKGFDSIRKALELIPGLKIIALTMFGEFGEEEYYYKMIELGVKGFILKSCGINELETAIVAVMTGKSYFSKEIPGKITNIFNR